MVRRACHNLDILEELIGQLLSNDLDVLFERLAAAFANAIGSLFFDLHANALGQFRSGDDVRDLLTPGDPFRQITVTGRDQVLGLRVAGEGVRGVARHRLPRGG